MGTAVSVEPAASIFRVEEIMRATNLIQKRRCCRIASRGLSIGQMLMIIQQ
jgi:hypothetical protein